MDPAPSGNDDAAAGAADARPPSKPKKFWRNKRSKSPFRGAEEGDEVAVEPEVVYMKLECSILKIDELNNVVTFDVVFFFVWWPPSGDGEFQGAASGEGEFVKSKTPLPWHPSVEVYSMQTKTLIEESFYRNETTGWNASMWNYVIEINEPLELHRFPYDRQIFKLKCELQGGRLEACPIDIAMPAKFQKPCLRFFASDVSNWGYDNVTLEIADEGDHNKVYCWSYLSRDPVFFLTNIVVIMFVLVLAAFSVVGVPYEDLSDRMSTTMTLMLTIVAFKFVISGYIPPTPYLTLLDKYILTAYILISTVMFENFVVAFALPPSLSVQHFDAWFNAIFSSLWIVFHLLLTVGTRRKWFLASWAHVRKMEELESGDFAMLDAAQVNHTKTPR